MLSSILKTKLVTIDNECEARARNEIDNFYKEVLYDGSGFRYPTFQEVGGVWQKLIQRKEKEFINETKRVLDAIVAIDGDQVSDVLTIVEGFLQDNLYSERLKRFAEDVARKASSYGIPFNRNPGASRSADLADAAYRVCVINLLRAARRNISTELQLYSSSRRQQMGFSSLMTDTISVLKKDGNRFDGIKASVQSGGIFISGCTLLIESGDLIQRKMSNGGEETFEVIDPGFHEEFHGIPAGYQMAVKKLGIPEAQKAVQHISYNFTGHNARINQSSVDNSTNVVNVNTDAAMYIMALRSAIQEACFSIHDEQSALDVIDAVDAQFQSGHPKKSVIAALLAALPNVANVATIVTSLLALL